MGTHSQKWRPTGKSDPLDAIEAARAALSGRAKGKPKSRDCAVEAIRVLVVAKRSARGTKPSRQIIDSQSGVILGRTRWAHPPDG